MKKFRIILFFLFFWITIFTFNVLGIENLDINAESAILIENKNNLIVYEKNSNEKMYPASTTKIMTALLVLENCKLDDTVVVSQQALNEIPDGYVVRRNLS